MRPLEPGHFEEDLPVTENKTVKFNVQLRQPQKLQIHGRLLVRLQKNLKIFCFEKTVVIDLFTDRAAMFN